MRVSKRILLGLGILLFAGLCLAQVFVKQRRPSAVAAAPTLSYTTGLKLWHKADAITGTNDGDGIGCWVDSSGNNYHSYQTTSGNRPIYKANIVNGYPAVQFDAPTAQHFFTVSNMLSGMLAGELFVVLLADIDPSATNRGFHCLSSGGGSQSLYPSTGGLIRDNFGTTGDVNGDPSQSITSFHLFNCFQITNDSTGLYKSTNYVNKVYVGGSSNLALGWRVSTNPSIGRGSAIGVPYFDGYIAEYILYDHVLSAANKTIVLTYLDQKYALPYTP